MTDYVDPFIEHEEAQQPAISPITGEKTYTTGASVAIGSPPSNGEVVLTFKGGTGFDAPWIVIHGADLEDAHRQVTDEAVLLASLMTQVAKAGSHFAANGSKSSTQGGNTGGRGSAPQGATEGPSWAPPKHRDDAVYKTGVSKAGKVWHAWMSPEKGGYDPKFFYQN